MKNKGPTKKSTRELILALEKYGKKSKAELFIDLAKRIAKPRRTRTSVNLWKLSKMAKAFPDKTLVVPGKVLSYGSLEGKPSVAAFEFSAKALEKIQTAGAKPLTLYDLVKTESKQTNLVLIK
jgi:large subunit ribosomal protein L18e